MPRKYTMRSKEEKLSIVKQVLNGISVRNWESQGIHHRQVQNWTKAYLEQGESGLEPKKKPGNPLFRYESRKELTYEEQLQYQIELLKRELVKKEAEVLRLKKLNERKGGGAQRKRFRKCTLKFKSRQTNILSANYAVSTGCLAADTISG